METIITAVGPDNVGLADPIVHFVTGQGANISEIQMYNHDEEAVFAMLTRIELPDDKYQNLCDAMVEVGRTTNLSIRVWSPELRTACPRLAIWVTHRTEPVLALLRAIRDGQIKAQAVVMMGNRPTCRGIAEQFDVDWHMTADHQGVPRDEEMLDLLDQYQVDYVVLARYMRNSSASHLLEIRRWQDHQPAPWAVAQLSRTTTLPRRICRTHADLRGHLPLHHPRTRCRQSDDLPVDVYDPARHEVGRYHPDRAGRQRTAMPGGRGQTGR